MKKVFIIIFSLLVSLCMTAQKKQASTLPVYTISNLKLGITLEEFKVKYPDVTEELKENSTVNLNYYAITLDNEHVVYELLACFYKGFLFSISFKDFTGNIHNGLTAKYGYDEDNEFSVADGTAGRYGKMNSKIIFVRKKPFVGDYNLILLSNKEISKKSQSEGF